MVVIGGSSGIGFEVARRARAAGALVTITGRDPQRLADAAETLGVAGGAVLDAHDQPALRSFFDGLGAADHIVSLVGDSMSGGFLTTSTETMKNVLHSKFWTNWLIGRHAADVLRPGGSLTFTSGTGGRPHDISATYVANLGLDALVQGLAHEMAPHHRVNAVAPTFLGTRTSFWKDVPTGELRALESGFAERVPLQRIGTVAEVASAYLFLLTNTFVTGQTLTVDGGIMLNA